MTIQAITIQGGLDNIFLTHGGRLIARWISNEEKWIPLRAGYEVRVSHDGRVIVAIYQGKVVGKLVMRKVESNAL